MPQAQAIAAAQAGARESRPQDEPSARESFYALAGEAVKKIGAPVVNDIVKKINQHGYAWGVQELQAQMAA